MMISIGIVEISNVVKGYVACDGVLKTASVEMVMAQPVCPGKFVMIFGGTVASVAAACDYVQDTYKDYIIDIQKFGNIEKRVFDGLNGSAVCSYTGAMGMIETFSVAACILAADAALKAANVDLCDIRIARGMGGKSYVSVTGTVGAVTAAVEAGAMRAQADGLLVDKDVIASPHEDLWQYIQ